MNAKGRFLAMAAFFAAVSASAFQAPTMIDDYTYAPSHGGGGHGSRGFDKHTKSKKVVNRRKKNKAAKKAKSKNKMK